jgi:hypothetical protein
VCASVIRVDLGVNFACFAHWLTYLMCISRIFVKFTVGVCVHYGFLWKCIIVELWAVVRWF